MSSITSTPAPSVHDLPAGFELTVADVAKDAEVAPSAVRFYETHAVITGYRTLGNQRRFNANAGCRIKVAKLAQRVGLTVKEIAELFTDLPLEPEPEDWGRVTEALLSEAEERVRRLKVQLAALGSTSRLCEVELP